MHTIANSHCRDLAAIVVAATLSMSAPAAPNNGSTAKASNRAGHEQQILQLMDTAVSLAVLRCESSFRMKSSHTFSPENYLVHEKAVPAETCWQYPIDEIFASAQSSPFPHRDAPRAREGTVARNDVRGFRALAKLRE